MCIITPLNLAFENQDEEQKFSQNIWEAIVDVSFIIDIVIVFNSAYYDE